MNADLRGGAPLENELNGIVGAALGSLLAGSVAYWKARTDKIGQVDKAVALAQSELAAYVSTELRRCHEQQTELRDDLDRRSQQRDVEREQTAIELRDIRERLEECERRAR